MRELTQSTAANVMVLMVDSTDHVSGKTGLTLTITASKAGGAFASITPTQTERGNGWYNLALTTSHTDTLGDLALHITGTAADPTDLACRIVAINKADSVRMGLTALPNAAAEASGGLITRGTGTGQLSVFDGIAKADIAKLFGDEQAAEALFIMVQATIDSATSVDDIGAAFAHVFAYYFNNANTLPPVASVAGAVGSVTTITNITNAISTAESNLISAINALNQSASRRIVLQVITQMERPESGSTNFEIEIRTYDADGAAVNDDGTPTITATGLVTGSLAANLSAVSNPSTGVYRATYNVESGDTLEQVRFVASTTIAASTFTMTAYSIVADFIAATWTTTDRALLQNASDNSTAILADTNELQLDWMNGGRLDLLIDGIKAKTDQLIFTTANRLDVQVFGMQDNVITTASIADNAFTAAKFAADSLDGKGDWVVAGSNEIVDIQNSVDSANTILQKYDTMIVLDGVVYQFTANALELVSSVSGVGDASEATLLLVKQQTDKITTSQLVVMSAIARGGITLKQGDSYIYANGLSGTLTIPKPEGSTRYPSDLTGYTVTLKAEASPDNVASGTGTISEVMTVTSPASTQDLSITSLTAAETAALKTGLWTFDIVAVSGSDTRTLISGTMKVDPSNS